MLVSISLGVGLKYVGEGSEGKPHLASGIPPLPGPSGFAWPHKSGATVWPCGLLVIPHALFWCFSDDLGRSEEEDSH